MRNKKNKSLPDVSIKKILVDWFTGKDNNHFDLSHVLWALGVLSLIGLEWDAVHFHHEMFDPIKFSIGLSGLLATGGWGVAQKYNAEPDPDPLPPRRSQTVEEEHIKVTHHDDAN